MEARVLQQGFRTKQPLSVASVHEETSLFTKYEIHPGAVLFDFSEEELQEKFEQLLTRLNKTFELK